MNNVQLVKIPLFSYLLLFLLISCKSDSDEVWVHIDPVQCLANPWEQEWLENNDYDYDAYYQKSDEEKQDVFVGYFLNFGLVIYDIFETHPYELVCGACPCPKGNRFHCLVDESKLAILEEFDFVFD